MRESQIIGIMSKRFSGLFFFSRPFFLFYKMISMCVCYNRENINHLYHLAIEAEIFPINLQKPIDLFLENWKNDRAIYPKLIHSST